MMERQNHIIQTIISTKKRITLVAILLKAMEPPDSGNGFAFPELGSLSQLSIGFYYKIIVATGLLWKRALCHNFLSIFSRCC